jgi:DNA-binding CsgD family transcriptional regulator
MRRRPRTDAVRSARAWADEAKEVTVTTDPYGEPNFVERSLTSSGANCLVGCCPACGTRLGARVDEGAFPFPLPHSIAAALLLTGTLSGREGAVFELLGMGYDNRSIAGHLGISERTVKRHITVILAKLHLESRLQAGLAALVNSAVTRLSWLRRWDSPAACRAGRRHCRWSPRSPRTLPPGTPVTARP